MNVKPDGFFGVVMAIEGISDSTVLLHGPDGCRKNLAALTGKVYPRPDANIKRMTPYYYGWPRIPCTGIASNDYVYGAYERLSEALGYVKGTASFIAVVNSPGASLIGDNCQKAIDENGLQDIAVVLDADLSSKPLNVGMDNALVTVLKKISPRRDAPRKGTVNILGNSVLQKDWESVNEEIGHILELMGLETISCVGAGSSIQNMRESANAEFNVLVCPEYAQEQARYYKEEFGITPIDMGYSPVGFEATEDFIMKIAEVTGKDPSKALEYVDRYKKKAYRRMLAARYGTTGYSFAIDADPCVLYPLTKWLSDNMEMVPVALRANGIPFEYAEEKLREYLERKELTQVMDQMPPEFTDVVMTDGNTAQIYERSQHCRRGVDLKFPSMMNVEFLSQPIYGALGSMYILERIVNRF